MFHKGRATCGMWDISNLLISALQKSGLMYISILRHAVDLNAHYAKFLTTEFMIQRREYGGTSIFSNSKHTFMPECSTQSVKNAVPSG
jgi:hypothetical protein